MKLNDWWQGRVFQFVHQHNLVYNTCWEDPRLDRMALELSPTDRVLVITSAGCNALDYVLQEPEHVFAVDLNPAQNSLLELKLAAIRGLEYDDFFAMFGRGRVVNARELYADKLRPSLSPGASEYWDRHIDFFSGERRRSFYFRGSSGWFAWLVNRYIDRVARARDSIEAILHAGSIAEQQSIYESRLRPIFWTRFIRWILSRDTTLSLVGVPRPQREQVERHYSGGIAQFVEDSIETVFTRLSLQDNYFWRVYLTGEYSPDCCPEYLRVENFERLRRTRRSHQHSHRVGHAVLDRAVAGDLAVRLVGSHGLVEYLSAAPARPGMASHRRSRDSRCSSPQRSGGCKPISWIAREFSTTAANAKSPNCCTINAVSPTVYTLTTESTPTAVSTLLTWQRRSGFLA